MFSVVGCGLQQLCGLNTLMYYSATLVTLKYIDIIGRRKILIYSAPGMVVGLVLAPISFHCKFLSGETRFH